jgi:hypothetical protein
VSEGLLSTEMTREHRKWACSTRLYGTLYPTFRVFLIVASSLVAAKESLAVDLVRVSWAPAVLAVSVTIVTALDTWLRPRDKWRGFMKDRDNLASLRMRAEGVSLQDSAAIEKEFSELRRRHREENVL